MVPSEDATAAPPWDGPDAGPSTAVHFATAITDAMTLALVTTDADGTVLHTNPAAREMFRLPPERADGFPVTELMPRDDAAAHGGYFRLLADDLRPALHGVWRPATGVRRGGTPFAAHICVSLAATGARTLYVVMVRDLTEEQRLRRERLRGEELAEAVIDTVGSAIVVVDAAGTVLRANGAARGRTGLPLLPGDDLAAALASLSPVSAEGAGDLPGAGPDLAAALAPGGEGTLLGVLPPGCERRWLRVRTRALATDEGVRVVTLSDVSEAVRTARAKQAFVSVVSHELRSPLTAVNGALGLLVGLELADDPLAAQLLGIATRGTARLIDLVGDIVDLEQVSAGGLRLVRGDHDLGALVDAVLATVARTGPPGALDRVRTARGGDLVAAVDPERISRVVTHLVSNALRFSGEGTPVDLVLGGDADRVWLDVIDRGSGIPADRTEAVFLGFEPVDSSTSREREGGGVGLAVSRRLVERHGGTLTVATALGEGSTFSLVLPRRAPADPDAPTQPQDHGGPR